MARDTPLPVVGCPTPSPDPSMGFRISLCLDSRVARMQMSSVRVSTKEGQREPELEKYDSNQRLKLRSEVLAPAPELDVVFVCFWGQFEFRKPLDL